MHCQSIFNRLISANQDCLLEGKQDVSLPMQSALPLHLIWYKEWLIRPAQVLAGGINFLSTQGCPMHTVRICLVGRSKTNGGGNLNNSTPVQIAPISKKQILVGKKCIPGTTLLRFTKVTQAWTVTIHHSQKGRTETYLDQGRLVSDRFCLLNCCSD